MSRLPQPGADDGQWGDILNDYLLQSHNADGSVKDDVVGTSNVQDGAITEAKLDSAVATKLNSTTDVSGKADKTTTITGAQSITGGGDLSTDRTLSLVGDSSTPGNDTYYGTDGTGTKGFYSLPASGVQSVVAGNGITIDNTDAANPVVSADSETLPATLIDAKGDLITGTAADTAARLAVGTDGQVLTADSTQSSGMKWGPPAPAGGVKSALFKLSGTLSIGVGATRLYNDSGSTWTISSIRASVETAPSGGTVVIDINKNDTTLFSTQSNRPTIASGNMTSGKVTAIDVTNVADGDYLTVDVDTTTNPAANLTVTVVFS